MNREEAEKTLKEWTNPSGDLSYIVSKMDYYKALGFIEGSDSERKKVEWLLGAIKLLGRKGHWHTCTETRGTYDNCDCAARVSQAALARYKGEK